MKRLKAIDMKRCIGCYSCVLACARLVHKSISWQKSGIQIHSLGGLSTGFDATYCLACDPPPCAEACPTEALKPKKGGGIMLVSKYCIGCGNCAKACPIGAITFDSESQKPIFCLHCGQCVNFCPHHCLSLVDVKEKPKEQP